jgi:hypothetical protein
MHPSAAFWSRPLLPSPWRSAMARLLFVAGDDMPSNNPAETLVADIRTGGVSRRHAFDFIEQEFGSQFRSGGKVAAESYIEALNIVRRADPTRAAIEFTERFIDMLDMAAKELLISRIYIDGVTKTLAKKETQLIERESALSSKKGGWFRRIFG